MLDFICDGTRNSKWYYDGVSYVRRFETRKGTRTQVYSRNNIKDLPENKDTLDLKNHLNNLLTSS